MTTYIVSRYFNGSDGAVESVSDDRAQDILADFFADESMPDGASVLIRKAGYMGRKDELKAARLRLVYGGGDPEPGSQAGDHNTQVNHFIVRQDVRAGRDVHVFGDGS